MPGNVHDTLFKATFSQVEHAASVLRLLLPPALVSRLDFDTLALCPGSFVDEVLTERFTDLLFSIVLADRPAFLYVLLEHQSTSEPLMPFRLLRYMVRIWEAFLKEHPKAKRLPAIIPAVMHHSGEGWKAAVSFEAVLDVDAPTLEAVAPYVPRFRFMLDDLSAVSDEELRGRAMSALGRLVLWCLRNARTPEEIVRGLGGWIELVREVRRAPNGAAALATIYKYIFVVSERFGTEELVEMLTLAVGEEGREEMASVADQLREEGERKGLVEGERKGLVEGERKGLLRGRREIVLRLLRARFGELPEADAARVNAADITQLDVWAERVLSAQTLADILGPD